MKKVLLFFFIAVTLLIACGGGSPSSPTPVPMPDYLQEVWPSIQDCFSKLPDIEWDGKFGVQLGTTFSSAQFMFDTQKRKAIISEVIVAGDISHEKQGIALQKESCYVGIVLQSAINSCLKSWDPLLLCMPPDTFEGAVDAFSTSYLTESQQELFFSGISTLHLEPGKLDFSCDTLKIFQQWSKQGVNIKGNWQPLLDASNCT